MITHFDKMTCKVLSAEIVAALEAVARKHGLTVQPGGGTIGIGGIDFTAKAIFKVTDTQSVQAAEKAEFAKYCGLYDLKPEAYGVEFDVKGVTYAVIGFANSAKWPVKARRLTDGNTVQFTDRVLAKVREAVSTQA
jgi:hypothetical protein